jgi:Flp pilus assembly protein protease CpaA
MSLDVAAAGTIAALAAWIVVSDAWSRRIPNPAILGLVAVWAVSAVADGSGETAWRGVWAAAALVLLGLPLHMTGRIGGGDVKLVCTAILLVPLGEFWDVVVLFYVVFGLHAGTVAVLCLVRGQGLRAAGRQLRAYPLGVPLGAALGLWAVVPGV